MSEGDTDAGRADALDHRLVGAELDEEEPRTGTELPAVQIACAYGPHPPNDEASGQVCKRRCAGSGRRAVDEPLDPLHPALPTPASRERHGERGAGPEAAHR